MKFKLISQWWKAWAELKRTFVPILHFYDTFLMNLIYLLNHIQLSQVMCCESAFSFAFISRHVLATAPTKGASRFNFKLFTRKMRLACDTHYSSTHSQWTEISLFIHYILWRREDGNRRSWRWVWSKSNLDEWNSLSTSTLPSTLSVFILTAAVLRVILTHRAELRGFSALTRLFYTHSFHF
jgi:hypothetical protein